MKLANVRKLSVIPLISILTISNLNLTYAFAGRWFGALNTGLGFSAVGKTQNLLLLTTPTLVNRYSADRNTEFSSLIGVEGGYKFNLKQKLQLALTLQAAYLHYGAFTGTVHPCWNITQNMDPYGYSYNAASYLLMVHLQLLWMLSSSWQPFISSAMGAAWNRLSGYSEYTLPGSTGAPMLIPFRNNTCAALAFALGLGVNHQINQHLAIQFSYRYIYAGHGELGTTPLQNTNQRLQSGLLSAHLFAISLLFS